MICIFKCVSCGDKMTFSMEEQAMVCPTCGSVCEMENYDMSNITYEGAIVMDDQLKKLHCPSCGAKVTVKEGSAKLNCGYCQSELAAFGVNEDILSPEKIIPFKITEAQAKSRLFAWWTDHKTMPKLDVNKLQMSFKEMYVPVWLTDSEAVTDLSAKIEGYYERIQLPHNFIRKVQKATFNQVAFDASCHIQDEQFYNIEPYDYSEMTDFNAGYLSGYMAECYHQGPDITVPRVVGRIKKFAFENSKTNIETDSQGGSILELVHQEIDVTPTSMVYLLVPVWVCRYIYRGVKKYVYINGQTGKVDGEVLFTGNKMERNVIAYGISAFWMSAVLIFSISSFFSGSLPSLIEVVVFVSGFIFLLTQFVRNIFGSDKRIKVRADEEIQLRHGMKVDTFAYTIINIVIAAIMTFLEYALSWPRVVADGKVSDNVVIVIAVAMPVTYLLIKSFASKLVHFEKFTDKTRYVDYINVSDSTEILKETW